MNTPKERHATVICLQGGRILMVRKQAPIWSLPGGKIDTGEDHPEAARRELEEETTLPLVDAQFLKHYVFDTEEHYLYQMAVPASLEPHASDEIVECRWFGAHELDQVAVKPTNIALLRQAGLLGDPPG